MGSVRWTSLGSVLRDLGGGDFGGFWGFRCCFFERVVLSCEIPAILEAALSVPEEFLRVLDLLSSAS